LSTNRDELYLINPDLEKTRAAIIDSLAKKRVIIIVGLMTVDYIGRASSHIGKDDKILIIKEDRAVLIHNKKGYKPVNWQPDVETIRTHLNDNLIIEFVRRKPREILRVAILKVYFIYSRKLHNYQSLQMYFTEEQLKDLIKKKPDLIENKLKILGDEIDVPKGKVDLLARDKDGRIVIIELKKGKIGSNEVLQLYRYVKHYRKTNKDTRGIIIGSSISNDAQKLLKSLNLEYKQLNLREIFKKLDI